MAAFHPDENFSGPVCRILREKGHTVITPHSVGRAGLRIPDEEVLLFATQRNLIVLTFNRDDFVRLHRSQPTHAGIITCTVDKDVAALAERIHLAVTSTPILTGQLLRITRPHR